MDPSDPQRLAEMEERLRVLQEELEAELGSPRTVSPRTPPPRTPPPRTPPPRTPPPRTPPPARPRPPAGPPAMATHLVRAMRELLDGYEVALAHTDAGAARLDVSAGPFADTAALEAFARAVRELPGVLAAEVRGYGGADRAIVEIELSEPRSGGR